MNQKLRRLQTFIKQKANPKKRVDGMEVRKLGEGVKWMEGGGGGERCNSVMQLKYFANQERCRGAKV